MDATSLFSYQLTGGWLIVSHSSLVKSLWMGGLTNMESVRLVGRKKASRGARGWKVRTPQSRGCKVFFDGIGFMPVLYLLRLHVLSIDEMATGVTCNVSVSTRAAGTGTEIRLSAGTHNGCGRRSPMCKFKCAI